MAQLMSQERFWYARSESTPIVDLTIPKDPTGKDISKGCPI